MKITFLFTTLLIIISPINAQAFRVFNLNIFDQLQGTWEPGFREQRVRAVKDYLQSKSADLVVMQEARSLEPGALYAFEGNILPFAEQNFVPEMTGADGQQYGYWMGSKNSPQYWLQDGFAFPGGVARKTQAALFRNKLGCLGVLSLHLSYQSTEVRQKEADWILDWLKREEKQCPHWLVLGDFNADVESAEMKKLFAGGLKNLFQEMKPTVGPFNPIRRIYGENIPNQTIDWALGWNIDAKARVVLDQPWKDTWVSDHAALEIEIPSL